MTTANRTSAAAMSFPCNGGGCTPAAFMRSPEDCQPEEQAGNDAQGGAHPKLMRNRLSQGGLREDHPRNDRAADTHSRAEQPRRKKGSEQRKRGRSPPPSCRLAH